MITPGPSKALARRFQRLFMLMTVRPLAFASSVRVQANAPMFVSRKPTRRQRREHIGTDKGTETLPAVCPLYVADDQMRKMTSGKVNVYGGDNRRCEWAQHEARQRKHKARTYLVMHLHL
jgi:hypothetical protein